MLCSYYIFSSAQSNQAVAPGYEFWNPAMQAIAKPNSKPGWIYFKDDFTTPPEQIFTLHKEAFGLGVDDSVHLFKQKTDDLGWTHYFFQHYNNSMKVVGSEMVLHFKNQINLENYLIGTLRPNIEINNTPIANIIQIINSINLLDPSCILNDSVINYLNFYNINFEKQIFYNQKGFLGEYIICFLVPYVCNGTYKTIYLNALNYEYVSEIIHNPSCTNVHETCTDYNGEQQIKFFQIENTNIIFENTCNNAKLVTREPQITPDPNVPPYSINTTDLECSSISNLQKHVFSSHWALEKTIEFFSSIGINCLTQNCIHEQTFHITNPLISSKVSSDYSHVQLFNYGALSQASLDIVGHEWAHMFNYHVGSNIGYVGNLENSAINEGMADIFGLMVEFYAEENFDIEKNGDWYIGEDFMNQSGNYIRNISNPHDVLIAPFGSPTSSTYGAVHPSLYWNNGNQNTTPHLKSTVLSHWFYLLSEGGSGKNDHGFCYSVRPVTKEIAFNIFFRSYQNVGQYVTFENFKNETLNATNHLYPGNSRILESVSDAWNAVGLYDYSNSLTNHLFSVNNNFYYFGFNPYSNSETWASGKHFILNDLVLYNGLNLTINTNDDVYLSDFKKIIVKNGATLNINNSNFQLGQNAEIIVENGGTLIIENNSSFEYFSSCDNISLYPQNTCPYFPFQNTWNGISAKTGSNINISNSTFKNAKTAIAYNSNGASTSNINISDNFFEDNIISMYIDATSNTGSFIINNNTIQNPIIADPMYYSDVMCTPDTWHHPVIFGNGGVPDATVYLINTQGLQFNDNNFSFPQLATSHPNYSNYGGGYNGLPNSYDCSHACNNTKGIYAFTDLGLTFNLNSNIFTRWDNCIELHGNGNYLLTNNEFNDFDFSGVKAINTNLTMRGNIFNKGKKYGVELYNPRNTTIDDNNEFHFVRRCIYGQGSGNNINVKVENNFFGIDRKTTEDTYGVYFDGVRNFLIADNTFTKEATNNFTIGPAPTTPIPANPQNPNFYMYGIVAKNSGSIADNYIFKNKIHPHLAIGVQTEQNNTNLRVSCNEFGLPNYSGSSIAGLLAYDGNLRNQGVDCTENTNQAGNEWMNLCNNAPNDNLQPRRDIIVAPQAQQFEYWAHAYNQDLIDPYTNQPKETTVPYCSNFEQGKLRVCNQAFNINSQTQFKDVNSCVHYNQWKPAPNTGLPARIAELLTGRNLAITNLTALQNQLYDKEVQKELVQQIQTNYDKIVSINEELVKTYYEAEMKTEALLLLENDDKIESKYNLYNKYIEEKEFENAGRILNDINQFYKADYLFTTPTAEQNFEEEKDYFGALADIEKTLLEENRTWKELASFEKYFLQEIADANVHVSPTAKVWLHLAGEPIGANARQIHPELHGLL